MKSEEDHYRFDIEELIDKSLFAAMDLTELINRLTCYMNEGKEGQDITLNEEYFAGYLKNGMLKNNFIMTILKFNTTNTPMTNMTTMS
jgi:hypothetical protein